VDREQYMEVFSSDRGSPTRAYEGFSAYSEDSSAASLHAAIMEAAKAAANDGSFSGQPEWFEITRLRILVGNPNVKVYGATITASHSGDGS
jgi:hypothetical protein